jgi:hypothetical protein
MNDLEFPLSNVQVELLKLYSTDLNDKNIEELKNILAAFYANKATDKANAVWDEKGLTEADMEKWLNEKS